jgi:hypothetical protein
MEVRWEPEGHPTNLYKFRSLDGDGAEFTRQIVVESKLYLASPASFNDPFDALPNIWMKGSVRKELAYFRRLTRTYRPDLSRSERLHFAASLMAMPREAKLRHLRAGAQETVEHMAVCSFAQSPSEVLMWSHYAKNHTGICLRFNTAHHFFRASLPLEVKYSQVRPGYNAINPGPPEHLVDLLLTKAIFWNYEKEWRLVETKDVGTRPFPPQALDGIYFGCRTSTEHKEMVRRWVVARGRPLELHQAVAEIDTFGLKFERVE